MKKPYLSLAFSALTITAITQTSEQTTTLQATFAHIAEQKKAIISIMESTIASQHNKELDFMREQGNDIYRAAKQASFALLAKVVSSESLLAKLQEIVNNQTELIVAGHSFEATAVNSVQLEEEVQALIEQAALNEHTKQLYYIFYDTITLVKRAKMVLVKLTDYENQIVAELSALQASNQSIEA